MSDWCHRYLKQLIDTNSTSYTGDALRHGPFYSVCQAIFYVIIFRHQQILDSNKGGNLLNNFWTIHAFNCFFRLVTILSVIYPRYLVNFDFAGIAIESNAHYEVILSVSLFPFPEKSTVYLISGNTVIQLIFDVLYLSNVRKIDFALQTVVINLKMFFTNNIE